MTLCPPWLKIYITFKMWQKRKVMERTPKCFCMALPMNANWWWHCWGGGDRPIVWVTPAGHRGITKRILGMERGLLGFDRMACCFYQSGNWRWREWGRRRTGDDWFIGWLAGYVWKCVCLWPAGHTVDDRLARPQMGQAPSAPQAAPMRPSSLHSPQPTRTKLWLPVFAVVLHRLPPCYGRVVSESEPQSFYLPGTIKLDVCLCGAAAELSLNSERSS